MKCENCGNELSANDLFCNACGQQVITVNKKNKFFCGNCGAEMEEGALFCGECGFSADGTTRVHIAKTQSYAHTKSKKTIIMTGTILVMILALTASFVFGYKMYRENDDFEKSFVDKETDIITKSSETPVESANTEYIEQPNNMNINADKMDIYYVVNCNTNISLRNAPNVSAEVIKEIPLGAPVSYAETAENGFAKIVYNGITGYALQAYLSKDAVHRNITKETNTVDNANGLTTGSSAINNPVYKVYNDREYNFVCAYPTHFQEYIDSDNRVRYSLRAEDGTATLKICAYNNISGLSPEDSGEEFKAAYPGTIEYDASGDNWYAVRTSQNGQCHYGYYHIENGTVRGFEMHYDKSYDTIYDKYINDIYDYMQFN